MPRSSKPDPDDPAACERAAVGLLARREHGRGELQRKLEARFAAGVVAATLDRLEQNGLLSSQRFMDSFVESRAARGVGPLKIRAELVRRGIEPSAAATATAARSRDWSALARRVRRKRFGAQSPRDFKERARQARFLQYRGFDAEQIDAALDLGGDSD